MAQELDARHLGIEVRYYFLPTKRAGSRQRKVIRDEPMVDHAHSLLRAVAGMDQSIC